MRNSTTIGSIFGGMAFFWLALIVFNIFIGGYCVEYIVEFWGARVNGVPYGQVDVPFWVCALVGIPLGEPAIAVALITFVFSFVLI